MQVIEGYGCIVDPAQPTKVNVREYLFIPDSEKPDGHVFFPGKAPVSLFDSKAAATRAKRIIRLMDEFKRPRLCRIRMVIAETLQEMQKFTKAKNLIVLINQEDGRLEAIGRVKEEDYTAYPLPGAYLMQNRHLPFLSYQNALWTLNDACRQTGWKCQMATFTLTRLE